MERNNAWTIKFFPEAKLHLSSFSNYQKLLGELNLKTSSQSGSQWKVSDTLNLLRIMSWSESFKILRRDIHQLLQLDTRSFIHSTLERTLASRGSQTVMFQVEWDFEAYVESELDSKDDLPRLLTVTGNVTQA